MRRSDVITGEYSDLAMKLRELMGDLPINLTALKTGVSHDTIRRTLRGERPGRILLDQIARGFKIHPNLLRALASYPLMDDAGIEITSERPEMGEFVTLVTGDEIKLRRDNPNPQATVDALNTVLRAIYQTQPPDDPRENLQK